MTSKIEDELTPLQIHKIRERAAFGEDLYDIWLSIAPESHIGVVHLVIRRLDNPTSREEAIEFKRAAQKRYKKARKKYLRNKERVDAILLNRKRGLAERRAAGHHANISPRQVEGNKEVDKSSVNSTSELRPVGKKRKNKWEELEPRPDPVITRGSRVIDDEGSETFRGTMTPTEKIDASKLRIGDVVPDCSTKPVGFITEEMRESKLSERRKERAAGHHRNISKRQVGQGS